MGYNKLKSKQREFLEFIVSKHHLHITAFRLRQIQLCLRDGKYMSGGARSEKFNDLGVSFGKRYLKYLKNKQI